MPAIQPSSNKRDELVELASVLFYRQGYGATGIKQIIDEAGIAKGTFYSHFNSKDEVGLAWLRKRHRDWTSWLNTKLAEVRGAKGKVLALFDFLEAWMIECDFRGCAFLNTLSEIADPDHAMRREVESHKRGLRTRIESLVADCFPGRSAALIKGRADIVFLLFEGALVESQNLRDTTLIATARKEVKTLLTAPK